MTKQELSKMINTCNSYHSCALCPYNPEDISRFIGGKWIGGCPNYDRKLVDAMSKGYRKIDDDYFDVITKDELKQYKAQAVNEFAEKVKNKLFEFFQDNEGLDGKISVGVLYIDVIGVEAKDGTIISLGLIDKLLKEYENEKRNN